MKLFEFERSLICAFHSNVFLKVHDELRCFEVICTHFHPTAAVYLLFCCINYSSAIFSAFYDLFAKLRNFSSILLCQAS